MDVAEAAAEFRQQADFCAADEASPVYARLFEDIAEALPGDTALQSILGPHFRSKDHLLPLRLGGALHFLALSGNAPDYAVLLPSCGGTPIGDRLWPAARAALFANATRIARMLERPPQTNEVARSAVLLPAFLRIARTTGCALSLLEIGASAGLNLNCDRYAYRFGAQCWGSGRPVIACESRGATVPLDGVPQIVARRGCDTSPIDVADPAAVQRLKAYVWPDQIARFARLDEAIAVMRAFPVTLDRANAENWIGECLARRPPDIATVIYHSCFWQYLDEAARTGIRFAIEDAGKRATATAPLVWLRFEPRTHNSNFMLTLSLWPDGTTEKLARAHPHAAWIDWRA